MALVNVVNMVRTVLYRIVCWTVGKTEEFFDEQLAAPEVNSWSMHN